MLSVCKHVLRLVSYTLKVLSYNADASLVKSCEKATELTGLLWPFSVCRHALLLVSYTWTALLVVAC
jgi:hypothetical protein